MIGTVSPSCSGTNASTPPPSTQMGAGVAAAPSATSSRSARHPSTPVTSAISASWKVSAPVLPHVAMDEIRSIALRAASIDDANSAFQHDVHRALPAVGGGGGREAEHVRRGGPLREPGADLAAKH